MIDETFKKKYYKACDDYLQLFGEAPSRMLLRGMSAKDAYENIIECIKNKQPLEKFYLDNHYLS